MAIELNEETVKYLERRMSHGGHEGEQARAVLKAAGYLEDSAESQAEMERHDEAHHRWHAMHGDQPCKDEADCARMRASYEDDDTQGN